MYVDRELKEKKDEGKASVIKIIKFYIKNMEKS